VASTRASSQVDSAHTVSIPIKAVLPTPWPLASTILQGMVLVDGFWRWSRISARLSAILPIAVEAFCSSFGNDFSLGDQ
jgi:hypothetical protein